MMKRIRPYLIVLCAIHLAGAAVADARTVPCALVIRDGYFHAIDSSGQIIADSLRYMSDGKTELTAIDEGMFVYIRNNRLGFKDHHNRVAVPPVYKKPPEEYIDRSTPHGTPLFETRFRNGLAIVSSIGNKFGIVNRSGQLIVDTVYDYIAPPDSDVYAARRGDTLHLLDRTGRNLLTYPYVTDPKLYPHPRMREGRLCVLVRVGGIPYRDLSGLTESAFQFRDRSVWDMHTYKAGFVDRRGRLVIDTVFSLSPFILGNSTVDRQRFFASGAGCGFAGQQTSINRPERDPYYLNSDYYEFSGGRILAWNGKNTIVINDTGDSLFAIRHARAIRNLHGYFSVSDDPYPYLSDEKGSYHVGLYNPAGTLIVPKEYYSITDANAGCFLISKKPYSPGGNDCFYVDRTGARIFAASYANAGPFTHGYADVSISDHNGTTSRRGRIDTLGRLYEWKTQALFAADTAYLLTGPSHGDMRLTGIQSWRGEWIIPPVYPGMMLPSCGRIAFAELEPGSAGNRWGYMDTTGRVLIAPQFQGAFSFQLVEIPDDPKHTLRPLMRLRPFARRR